MISNQIMIRMPQGAKKIIEKLNEAGYEAYIVGGCVRDAILGKEPDDWDITTSAKPQEVKALFPRTVDTGIQHGTVTVIMKNFKTNELEGYEVTTYRVDGTYTDHRRPTEVTFTASLIEDMKRRDFTINAMAYNDKEGVIDHFEGMSDLEKGVIRCVGNPRDRFDEDALRILRAVRFGAQLDFDIEETTRLAIREQAQFLQDISAERIHVELSKLLLSAHPERIREAYELGVTAVVLPELDRMMETDQNHIHHCYTVGEHSIKVVQEVDATETLRWAALLHDVAKPMVKTSDARGDHFYGHSKVGAAIAKGVLRRLKFDNATTDRVVRLVEWHDYGIGEMPSLKSFRKSLSKMNKDLFDDFVVIKRADILAQSDFMRDEKLANLEAMKEYYQVICQEQQCICLKEMELTGKDLIAMGMQPGKDIGIVLSRLLDQVLENPELNKHDTLLELAKDMLEINE